MQTTGTNGTHKKSLDPETLETLKQIAQLATSDRLVDQDVAASLLSDFMSTATNRGQATTTRFWNASPRATQKEDWGYLQPVFTPDNVHPFERINWVRRDAIIKGGGGKIVYEQKDVEFPDFYSQNAVNIIAQKYFRGRLGIDRETSMRQVIGRVADTLTRWGVEQGYFTQTDAGIFNRELAYILVHQYAAFNSPVWFNVGVVKEPQCSACFINGVEDTMDSILDLAVREGNIFKRGSGAGSNYSKLRGSTESLSVGGKASGPVSFMRGWDAFAGAIKSGGATRRAAKMAILDSDHPDLEEFIWCKALEEKKARLLQQHGLIKSFDEIQNSVYFQNANNSVRATDAFMQAVINGEEWVMVGRKDKSVKVKKPAKDLMRQIAQAAWECGDPGMQFDTTINRWHTSPFSGRQNATNPCSEFTYLDDTSCNLASINLVKFLTDAGTFDVIKYKHVIDILFLAQELIVDGSSYPTPLIARNSHRHRPLGLGYANLGMLLAMMGLAYDSEEGRNIAASVTAIMHGRAVGDSAEFSHRLGDSWFPAAWEGSPTEGADNRKPMLNVIKMHMDAAIKLAERVHSSTTVEWWQKYGYLFESAVALHETAFDAAQIYGVRNSQFTLLAPTGTISFLMDCDTTGIEPVIMWVMFKALAGGGSITIALDRIKDVLLNLGYTTEQVDAIYTYVTNNNGRVAGAPGLKGKDLKIFDTAFGWSDYADIKGEGAIAPSGHVLMMSAVQPFLSGAISKTVNMPETATVEEVEQIFIDAWKAGVKCIAIYRDNCKAVQPLTQKASENHHVEVAELDAEEDDVEELDEEEDDDDGPQDIEEYIAVRWPMPDERPAVNHKFTIGGLDCYLTVGLFPDTNRPGEIFITVSKQGSLLSGVMGAFATSISLLLQHGVPLERLCDKFKGMRFDPAGFTGYQGDENELRSADSIIDYVFKWMEARFLKGSLIKVEAPLLFISERAAEMYGSAPTKGPYVTEDTFKSHHFSSAIEASAPPALPPELEPTGRAVGFKAEMTVRVEKKASASTVTGDACTRCGSLMRRTGACKTCPSCGENTGCG